MTSSLGTSQRWPSRAPKSSFENGNKVMLADEFCQELHDHYGRTPSGILGSVLNELVFVRLLQLELMHVINISATLALIGRAAEAHWAVPWLKGQAPAMVGDPVPSAPASPAAGASALGSALPRLALMQARRVGKRGGTKCSTAEFSTWSFLLPHEPVSPFVGSQRLTDASFYRPI